MNKKLDKYEVPDWMGRFPFEPDKKKVCVIRKEMEASFIYGFEGTEIENYVYTSTDNLSVVEWGLASGLHIGPAAQHLHGDECYYLYEGELTVCNPESGESFVLNEGEAIYIPQETRHQGFNFGSKKVTVIACMAPVVWAEDTGSVIPQVKNPRFLKGPEEPKYGKTYPLYVLPQVKRTMDALGNWPAPSSALRKEKQMVALRSENRLNLISGKERHIFYSFMVSNDYMNVAIATIPIATTSEIEKHNGDEVINVLEGELCVRIVNPGDGMKGETAFPHMRVRNRESLLIPAGVSHQYINISNDVIKAYMAIAPRL